MIYDFLCRSEKSLMTARWYSAWILFVDMIPVFLMYGIWATLTIVGKLKPNAVNMNEIIQENDEVQHRCKVWDSNSPLLLLSEMELASSSSSSAENGLLSSLQSSVVDIPPVNENKSNSSSGNGNITQRIRGWNEGSPDMSHHDQPSDHTPLLEKKASPM